jgi:hypothetical protein
MFRLFLSHPQVSHKKTHEQNTRTLRRIFLVVGARVVLPYNQSLGRVVVLLIFTAVVT